MRKLLHRFLKFSNDRPLLFVLFVIIVHFGSLFAMVPIIFVLPKQIEPAVIKAYTMSLTFADIFIVPFFLRSWMKVWGKKSRILDAFFNFLYEKADQGK